MRTRGESGVGAASTRGSVAGRLAALVDGRPEWILGAICGAFVLVHLARLQFILVNGDGDNYLRSALSWAHLEVTRSRYSPGFEILMAPLARITDGDFYAVHYVGGLLNIAVSVVALYCTYRFLQRYVGNGAALTLVAVLALGESASNVLTGIEVEPLSLLCVSATLAALQSDRSWVAAAMTALGVVSRIALAPFFLVLWVWQLGRRRAPAIVALASVVVGTVAYFALQSHGPTTDKGYGGIAADAYDVGGGPGSVLQSALDIVPDHFFRYLRLGIPSIVAPSAALERPLGRLLGLVISAIAVIGTYHVLRHRQRYRDPQGVLLPAIVGGLAYFALLVVWPANDSSVVRLVLPVAAPLLLVLGEGVRVLAGLLPRRLRGPATSAVVAAVLVVAIGVSGWFVVARHRNSIAVRHFLDANERAEGHLPPGPIMSYSPTVSELLTGHPGVSSGKAHDPEAVVARARRAGACSVVVDEETNAPGQVVRLREWAEGGGATIVATAGRTFVAVLPRERCSAGSAG